MGWPGRPSPFAAGSTWAAFSGSVGVPIAVLGAVCAFWLIPDSRNPAAQAPDLPGAVLSVTGLGLVLWALIEAPVRGWSSPVVIGAGASGLAILAVFAAWERASSHPMLNVGFFRRRRRFSAAISSLGLVTFGLFGTLFVMTQFLQFGLGYSALQAGVRVLPAAGAIAVVAPLSTLLVRTAGTKFAVGAGLLIVAGGLWRRLRDQRRLPADRRRAGVAVIGSLLNTRYQDTMTSTLAPYHVPHAVMQTILGSVGGALEVAARAAASSAPGWATWPAPPSPAAWA